MGSSFPEDEDGGLRTRRRNARSLDMATRSTREASKAAAWMWHMHGSSPTFKTETEDKPALNPTVWETKRRSNSCDRKDSRFRQEASLASAAASASVSVAALKPLASTTSSKPPDSSIWDCESKLYDTFELVSFSNRLDRSLLGIVPQAFDAPNLRHPGQSPLHHSTFAGVLRTFSLPRMLSVNNSMPPTHTATDNDGNHARPQEGMINASPTEANRSSVSPPTMVRKFSAIRRALTTKWTLSRLVKVLKKVSKFHKQMRCFQLARTSNFMARSELNIGNKDNDDDDGISEHQCLSDEAGGLSEHRRRIYEEKVNQGKGVKHFHHHHHHYHHHFVHHLDQFSQVAKEDNACKLGMTHDARNEGAEWPAGMPNRTESARLSSDTMSKICADVNWL